MMTKERMIWSQILKSNSLNYFFKEMYGNKSGQFAWFVELGLKGLNSCRAKIASICLVLAGYSAWHFFTDGISQIKYHWAGHFFDNSAIYFKTFWQPWESIYNWKKTW